MPDEIDRMLKVGFLVALGVSKCRSRCNSIIVTRRITTPWLPSFLHHSQECLDKCLHNDALASAATGVDGTYNDGVSHGSVHISLLRIQDHPYRRSELGRRRTPF